MAIRKELKTVIQFPWMHAQHVFAKAAAGSPLVLGPTQVLPPPPQLPRPARIANQSDAMAAQVEKFDQQRETYQDHITAIIAQRDVEIVEIKKQGGSKRRRKS